MGSVPGSVPDLTLKDQQFMLQGADLLKKVRSMEIIDEESFKQMAILGHIGKQIAKAIEAQYQPHVRRLDEAHKDLLKFKKRVMDYFDQTEKESKSRMIEAHDKFPDYQAGGTVFSSVWKIEVTDPELIPRQFMVPDMAKLQAAASALGEDCKIPGARVCRHLRVSFSGE